jgi:hypothetical protein
MKLLLFKVHAGDPLSKVIVGETRTQYTHAAVLVDELTNKICEAYVPHVRFRLLLDSELAGIEAFDIAGLTPEKTAGAMGYCAEAVAAEEPYSIENLCRFNPFLRDLLGEAQDVGVHSPVICSQFAFDVFDRGAHLKLLNAPSYVLAPGYLAWSTLLTPAAALKPMGNGTNGTNGVPEIAALSRDAATLS